MEVSGISSTQMILPVDISFRLGPRINASGRLADAALSVELLLSEDPDFSRETAQQLDAFNRERQDIERKITEDAERMIEDLYISRRGDRPLQRGVAPGGRRDRRRPRSPATTTGPASSSATRATWPRAPAGAWTGSAWSTSSPSCPEGLASWGGHPMAVGVSLPKAELDGFRGRFAAAVRDHVGGGHRRGRASTSRRG